MHRFSITSARSFPRNGPLDSLTSTSTTGKPSGSRTFGWILLASAILAFAGPPAHIVSAQDFPSRPVRVVVSTTPGGTTDFITRLIAKELNDGWSQGVAVENRPGAGGTIGYEYVAKSPPDGHVIAFVAGEFTVSAAVYKKLPYDPLADFAPVALVAFAPLVLVVNPRLPVRSVNELIAYVKQNPEQIKYSSTGNGGVTHLAAELLKRMSGIKMMHIPYKGTVPAVTDLMSGQVDLTFTGMATAMPLVTAGKLRLLAVTGKSRSPMFPDIPTVGESVPGFEFNNWFGILAPKATPKNVVAQLHDRTMHALQVPEVRKKLLAQNVEPATEISSAQFGEMIAKEIGEYTKLVKDIGVHID